MNNFLYGKTYDEISVICNSLSLPRYTAKQICDWLYSKGVNHISEMTNLSLKTRELLSTNYEAGGQNPSLELVSNDGTRKYIFTYGSLVEAVVIFDRDRVTLCISSQKGCKLNCRFCATGQQGYKGQMTPYEILNIFRYVNKQFPVSNIVFMGMGEPLDNWQNVHQAIQILVSDWGYGISPRRITISTSGIKQRINDLLTTTDCHVAISLHNAISRERMEIMPIEKASPIEQIIKTLRSYDWSGQRRLTFEYIVFDFNHTTAHIQALVTLLKGIECRINLIRYHQTPNSNFKGANNDAILKFANNLNAKGLRTIIRASNGEDIFAACGQLAGVMK
ncbi:MAG: 23S rRNA (adenine(2503)-C(2))-methyltransferase RlmN [Bacteroidales bacterium]|jgi:23S rRNA (adenine2503-C2)-methyltransferase|nr:23S rRNA (adenine(2503)-C(2))-methyltransferase RlmN [Bacteroidales bacterium]